jgi:hypothetical protein
MVDAGVQIIHENIRKKSDMSKALMPHGASRMDRTVRRAAGRGIQTAIIGTVMMILKRSAGISCDRPWGAASGS